MENVAEANRPIAINQIIQAFLSNPLVNNIFIGFTVSFVALSLGAAFGILSGRGAFIGMFSAGIFAFIAALLGGTRVQCSGPTAPMCAVSAVVIAYAYEGASALSRLPGYNPDHFINIVFILTGVMLVIMGMLRFGRFINIVPNVVISGFMSGIAILIWIGQLKRLFGFGGKVPFGGPIYQNVLVASATVVFIFTVPELLKKIAPKLAEFIPSTIVAIIVMTLFANLFGLLIEHVKIHTAMNSLSDFTHLITSQWPARWSWMDIKEALPFAFQLAGLCYLDTLLTSLVIDKISREETKQNKELMAQGAANAAVALIGGIPGAQATIRSVLMIKEGATMRISGVFVGVFVLLGMLIFQRVVNFIPQAVFAGILFKVGYDVLDFQPIRLYIHELLNEKLKLTESIFRRHHHEKVFVTHLEMVFILGTILVTVLVDLNSAVVCFTPLFYFLNRFFTKDAPIRDLRPIDETISLIGED